MRLFPFTICLFVFCSQGKFYSETIADRLQYLQQGDLLLFDLQNSVTSVEVVQNHDEITELRIIGVTKDILARRHLSSYLEWHDKGCTEPQFDERLTLHEKKGIVSSTLSHATWIETLLRLELFKIPLFSRRKNGAAPNSGELDLRRVWNPPIVVRGEKIQTDSEAYSAKWPQDDSPLSARILILYFPKSTKAINSFPYWIESPSTSFHVSVIDSKKQTCEQHPKQPQ